MTVNELQKEIIRLKKEKGVCILAHAYQRQDVLEVADFVGDSFALSRMAAKEKAGVVLMCGVRFMAETAKILSPDKRVLLSSPDAGCPMADQVSDEDVRVLRKKYPGYTVMSYINTTARVKAESDVCVTSASAVKIAQKTENNDILFIPDPNLGTWVKRQLPEKNIVVINGGCPAHKSITEADVRREKERHPEALLLVHPECTPEVTEKADFVGSTTEITEYAEKSGASEFIIGTENSITEHLGFSCPDKDFYPLSPSCTCRDMQLTDLPTVYRCLTGRGGEEIILPGDVIERARRPIDEMLRLG